MTNEEMALHTKQKLADALKKAMREKPFSKITVSELIKDCNVNRNTFYYHFEDIYALLKWIFEEEAIRIVQHFELLIDYREAISFVLDYIDQNDYLISCAYDSIGREEMKRFFWNDFTDIVGALFDSAEKFANTALDPKYKQFLIQFYTEALTSMIINYIKDKNMYEKEQIIDYLERIFEAELNNIKEM